MNRYTAFTTRLTSSALGLVLLTLAVFAIAGAFVANQAVARATASARLTAAYERARLGVSEEESLERKYRLEPGPAIRGAHRRAVADTVAAMRAVAQSGSLGDAMIARRVLRDHKPYLVAVGRMFDAVDRGETATVLQIDSQEVDPPFHTIEATVAAAAALHRRESAGALRHSMNVTRDVFLAAPPVFALGLAFLTLLWRKRRRQQQAAATELTHQNERLQQTLDERERAESELAETRDLLRNAQRLEAVGQLAGGIAHDFNNLLQIIIGYGVLIEKNVRQEGRASLAEIQGAAGRGADLTRQLLAFGGRQVMKPGVWDVNVVIADVETMLSRVLPPQIDFQAVPARDELHALVDRGQLEQVLVNLVLNARDAMPDGGTLTVFAEPFDVARPLVLADVELPAAAYARIVVRDTGCGMDEDTRSRVFEPFFTTKERGQGTGLGLATAYGIVHQSGGFISVESEQGIGTEFALYLPRAAGPAVESAGPDVAEPSRPRELEQLLLVDDEPGVRTVLTSYLGEHGYDVIEATDGAEGLEAFREQSEQIAVVVTDIVMPRLDGWSLANEIRRLDADVPVVVISGFPGHAGRASDECLEYLAKPFAPAELIGAIERATARQTRRRVPGGSRRSAE